MPALGLTERTPETNLRPPDEEAQQKAFGNGARARPGPMAERVEKGTRRGSLKTVTPAMGESDRRRPPSCTSKTGRSAREALEE
jgi:hypothetical protein